MGATPGSAHSPLDLKVKQLVDDAIAHIVAQNAMLEQRVTQLEGLCRTRQDAFFTICEATAFAFDLEPTEIGSWLVIHFLPAVKDRIPSGVVFYN